jgi:hypothetical protein
MLELEVFLEKLDLGALAEVLDDHSRGLLKDLGLALLDEIASNLPTHRG